MFINQQESEKFCAIKFAPTTLGCTNLTIDPKDVIVTDSSYIEMPLVGDIPDDGNICFIVVAGNGTNNVTIEGENSLSQTGKSSRIMHCKCIIMIIYISTFLQQRLVVPPSTTYLSQ